MALDLRKEIRIGSRVVFIPYELTGEVYRVDEGGVHVFVQSSARRDDLKGYWHWKDLTIRFPRKERRFPRPFRFPRLTPSKLCHCVRGLMKPEVWREKVRCKRCGFPIGTESYPERITRAASLYAQAFRKAQREGKTTPKKIQRRKALGRAHRRRSSPHRPKKR